MQARCKSRSAGRRSVRVHRWADWPRTWGSWVRVPWSHETRSVICVPTASIRTAGFGRSAAVDASDTTTTVATMASVAVGSYSITAKTVAFTTSGDSAKRLSRYRGPIPVLAFTPKARTRSQLALTWGVETFQGAEVEHTDEMVRQVDEQLLQIGRVHEGDLVVIVAGSPPGIPGSTNALRIHRMGDAINEVAPAYRSKD